MEHQKVISEIITNVVESIRSHTDELTFLDQAIGDGDHGANLRRGVDALSSQRDEIAALEFGPALRKAGTVLIMTIGGASGPLYGSALIGMSKVGRDYPEDFNALASLIAAGVNAVKARGRSDVGMKTMLDVFVPVQEAIERGESAEQIRQVALAAAVATKPIQARKGRAAFLGVRSIGHVDPGARSLALIVVAICEVFKTT